MANEEIEGGMVVVYYKGDDKVSGGPQRMFRVDANTAVRNFPGEWSFAPWPSEAPAPPAEPKAETKSDDPVKPADKAPAPPADAKTKS